VHQKAGACASNHYVHMPDPMEPMPLHLILLLPVQRVLWENLVPVQQFADRKTKVWTIQTL